MKKEMLINAVQPEECRIAILEDGVLEELYVERTSHESYVGNIYKGRIVNIEPSIQAAFVDFGIGRNGFLHVSDVEPAYYRHLMPQDEEPRRRRRNNNRRSRTVVSRPEVEIPSAAQAAAGEEVAAIPATQPESDEEAAPAASEVSSQEQPTETTAAPAKPVKEKPQPKDVVDDLTEHLDIDPDLLKVKNDDNLFDASSLLPPMFGEPTHISLVSSSAEEPGEAKEEQETATQAESSGPEAEPTSSDTAPEEDQAQARPIPSVASIATVAETTEEVASSETDASQGDMDEGESDDEDETSDDELDVIDDDFTDADLSFSMRDEEDEEEDAGAEEPEITPVEPEPAVEEAAVAVEAPSRPPASSRGPRTGNRRGGPRGKRRNTRPRGRSGNGRPKPPIQEIFKKGQEVLVQVIKDGIGTKGPTLSTYISIAGRYLVLMPGLNRIGVSRKITDEDARRRLKEIMKELDPPKGLGFIIRTAGFDRTKKELQRDLNYLARLWQVVVRRIKKLKAPAEIYQESDIITRTIRDVFTNDIETVWVDQPEAFEHAKEFLQIVMPRCANRIKLYEGPEPIFHKYGLEEAIGKIHERHVPLPNGGSIVIEPTEALVAIDVNSGNFRADDNAEETAYQINLQAAREIARQLRLRDLGGVIVNDFIDMRDERHRRAVERELREAVKRDRARTKILRMSAFGIIEMTRQRIRPSLKRSIYEDCPYCDGTGLVKTSESMSIDVMRMLQLAASRPNVSQIVVLVSNQVANYLLNRKRQDLVRLEERTQAKIEVKTAGEVKPEFLEFHCYDSDGNALNIPGTPRSEPQGSGRNGNR